MSHPCEINAISHTGRIIEPLFVEDSSRMSRIRRVLPLLGPNGEGSSSSDITTVTYRISESTMNYSSLLLSERSRVDVEFALSVSNLNEQLPVGVRVWGYDSSGHPCGGDDHRSLDMFELIECIPDRRLFSTLELGCCRVYCHHVFKTFCLTCVVISDSSVTAQVREFFNRPTS